MRISTNYIYDNTRRTMQQSISNLLQSQEVMASQQKINHLSDDPVGVGRILNVDGMISQNEQFTRNIETAKTVTSLYDGALTNTVNLLKRAKTLVLGETNSATSTEATREAARVELVSLASQLVSIGNLQYGDRFLFAGYGDDTAPFVDATPTVTPAVGNTGTTAVTYQSVSNSAALTGDTYEIRFTNTPPMTFDIIDTTTGIPVQSAQTYNSGDTIQFDGIALRLSGAPANGDILTVTAAPAGAYVGDSGVIKTEIDQGVYEQTNLTGNQVFQGVGTPGGVNLFDLFDRVNMALRSNDQTELDQLLTDFDAASSQITNTQSQIGSRENLLESAKTRLQDVKLNMDETLSNLRDVDITDAVTDLNRRENAYQAVLAASSKLVQQNLLDFLQ